MALEPPFAVLNVGINIINRARIQAGKVVGFRRGKQVFGRVQLGRVRREPVHRKPVALTPHEGPGGLGPMWCQPVPEKDDAPVHVASELLEAADDIGVLDRMGENP